MPNITDELDRIPQRLWDAQKTLGEARRENGKWMAKDAKGNWRQVWVVNRPASYKQPIQDNGS